MFKFSLHKLLFFSVILALNEGKSPEDFLNICIDSDNHKTNPGPESELFNQCTPWKNHSCCYANTSRNLHEENLYSLDYNHCRGNKEISPACLRHFTQDHCFYECSPNVGPWVVQVDGMSWRRERFFGVPLCDADCDSWYNDCKNDYTCVQNWSRDFTWLTLNEDDDERGPSHGTRCPNGAKTCKVNVCPKGSTCVPIGEMFKTAQDFCENVFDGSWKYTSSKSPCMRLWFSGDTHNPNDNVARYHAELLTSAAPALAEVVAVWWWLSVLPGTLMAVKEVFL